ncbi:MAG: RusA family crossover junction endodeoxyribonuclease [Candidimonas sp.]|nr:RusA family crossover junction endodeoxyribonuclease [Candidimonas sp.]
MTIKELEIVIPIGPVPASRARSVTGRAAYYLPEYNEWRKNAADVLTRLLANEARFGGRPVAVEYEFVCTRPKKPSKLRPRGDWDSYAKAVAKLRDHPPLR